MGAVGSWWSTALSVCKDDSSWRGGIHQRLGDSLVKEVCSYVTAGRGIFELSWPERWMYWTHFPKWACPRNLLPSLQHNAWLSSQYVLWLLLPVGRLVELEKKEEQVSYKGSRIPLESSSSFQLNFPTVTPSIVKTIFLSISPDPVGIHCIRSHLLRIAAPEIVPSVARLRNIFIENGVFLKWWKKAKVTPLFKGGKTDDHSNFSLSVLPVLSKVVECYIHDCFYASLSENNHIWPWSV